MHSRVAWRTVLSVAVALSVISAYFFLAGTPDVAVVTVEQPAQVFGVRSEAPIPPQYSLDRATGTLMNESFDVMIARTEEEQALGLGGLKSLKPREAMIFPYARLEAYGFWMKGMLFPIDIVWLDENLKIVSIQDTATPDSYPKIFFPRAPARFVVEFPAGTMKSLGATVGTFFEIDRSAVENQ
jgi:hypothetical protein